jgi:hypothetical protein
VLSREGADQSGEQADSLARFLGSQGHEVGLCQLDLLIHVIAGRLTLSSPRSGPTPRLDLVGIVSCRTPRSSTFSPQGPVRAGTGCHDAVPIEFPPTPRRVPVESRQPTCGSEPVPVEFRPVPPVQGLPAIQAWRCPLQSLPTAHRPARVERSPRGHDAADPRDRLRGVPIRFSSGPTCDGTRDRKRGRTEKLLADCCGHAPRRRSD